ncbi:MAG: HAMP domain-containing sensor histidine kinase [Candidatus Paceibacterota bacterium]|jgi:signal transduction histidine kinase
MNEIQNLISACEWGSSKFLIFSTNVFDPIIYYSHLFPLISSLILVIFLYVKSNKTPATKILLATVFTLGIWLLGDLILWATDKPSVTMYVWTIINMVEPMVYAGLLYFLYLFIDEKDISFIKKAIIITLLTPTVILASTKFTLLGYDISNCDRDAVEGPLVYYGYFIECIFILWMLFFAIKSYIKNKLKEKRPKIALITFGSLGFLIAFSFGNVIGSLFDANSIFGDYSWTVGQYGIFGIPIFLVFLTYVIVKYKTFKIKIFGAQILMMGLMILIGSQFFFIKTNTNQILTGITLVSSIVFGVFLIRSVKKEVAQREEIERLAQDLAESNEKLKELDQMKSEFLSLASHQIRAPLTAIKGYSSMLLEGDFGVLPQKATDSVQTIMKSCQNLINIVADFLNISRIEQGRMVYEKSNFDLAELTLEVINELKPNIENSGLNLEVDIPQGLDTKINADRNKIKQVIGNIIDNSLKYTLKGSLKISVSNEIDKAQSSHEATAGKVKIAVKDTGVGIDPSEMNKLFEKFSRTKDAGKTNVTGTGLGLYIAKKMVEAHGGDIKVSSEGVGKGTTFIIELPKTN